MEDAVARVRALRDRAVFDPERLEQIDGRLDGIIKLKRKYGDTVAAILARRQEIAAALDRIDRQDAVLEELERDVAGAARNAAAESLKLSEARTQAAERLGRLIQKEIRGLGMEQGRFRVALEREVAAADELACGDGPWRIGQRGAETAEFLLSANPGRGRCVRSPR